jgi:hypothetical protein
VLFFWAVLRCKVDVVSEVSEKLTTSTHTLDFDVVCPLEVSRDSVVATATLYLLDGLVFKRRWWRDFPHPSRSAPRPIQPPAQWVPGLSRGKAAVA